MQIDNAAGRTANPRWKWPLIRLVVVAALTLSTYKSLIPTIGLKLWGGAQATATVLMQLKWGADYLLGRVPEHTTGLFAFPIYYPYQNSFALSDTMLGNQPIWLPIYALTKNPVLATNVWVLICNALNLLVFAWYIQRASLPGTLNPATRRWAGLLCGALFAFSCFRLDRHVHLQLFPQFWTPLALVLVDQARRTGRWRLILPASIALALQWLSGTHLGMMAFALLLMLGLWQAVLHTRPLRTVAQLLSVVGVAVLLLLPVLVPRFRAVASGLRFEKELARQWSPGWSGLVSTSEYDLMSRSLGVPQSQLATKALFPGPTLMVLFAFSVVAVALQPKVRVGALPLGVMFLLLLVVATGKAPGVSTLPLFQALRRPSRLALAATVPGVLFVGVTMGAALRAKGLKVLVTAGLVCLTFELLVRRVEAGTYGCTDSDAFNRVLVKSHHRPVLLLPLAVGAANDQESARISLRHMELLSDSWVPGLAGRSGPRPPFVGSVTRQSLELVGPRPHVQEFIARVRRLGFVAIVVTPGHRAGEYAAALRGAMGGSQTIGRAYTYFSLRGEPEDAPLQQDLDLGTNVAGVIATNAFRVTARPRGPGRLTITVVPHLFPPGVVQKRTTLRLPYVLEGPNERTIGGELLLELDAVTDQPDLSGDVRAPVGPGWHIRVGNQRIPLAGRSGHPPSG